MNGWEPKWIKITQKFWENRKVSINFWNRKSYQKFSENRKSYPKTKALEGKSKKRSYWRKRFCFAVCYYVISFPSRVCPYSTYVWTRYLTKLVAFLHFCWASPGFFCSLSFLSSNIVQNLFWTFSKFKLRSSGQKASIPTTRPPPPWRSKKVFVK